MGMHLKGKLSFGKNAQNLFLQHSCEIICANFLSARRTPAEFGAPRIK